MPDINFDAILLMVIGVVVQSSDAAINTKVDEVADKLIAAVNSTETQIDDVLAKRVAQALARLATRVEAGV